MTIEDSTSSSTTTIIYPSSKHKRPDILPKIPLCTALDYFPHASQVLPQWFFHPPSDAAGGDVIDKLKSSLSEALELYPPVNGTVHSNDDGSVYIAMDDKNRPGTPFIFELKRTPYTGGYSEDLTPRTSCVMLPPGSCTLSVKVTQFSCGTIVVACSLHHQVADLRGLLDFVELWAQLARGEPVDMQKIPDDWSRTPGRFFPLPQKEPKMPSAFVVNPIPTLEIPRKAALEQPILTTWKITKGSLNQLKADFMPQSKEQWISSGDALTSLIFGAITRARENGNVPRGEARSSMESQVETISITSDCRSKSSKGYIDRGHYFGNFIKVIKVTVTRSDLLSPTLEAGGRVALTIRNDLKMRNSEKDIANYISFFEHQKVIDPPNHITWMADVYLANWCRFDLQGSSIDFGFGKPFNAANGVNCRPIPGFINMIQEKESGDIVFVIGIEGGGASQLKSDPLLNKYATLP